jgi:hypothetical protein
MINRGQQEYAAIWIFEKVCLCQASVVASSVGWPRQYSRVPSNHRLVRRGVSLTLICRVPHSFLRLE